MKNVLFTRNIDITLTVLWDLLYRCVSYTVVKQSCFSSSVPLISFAGWRSCGLWLVVFSLFGSWRYLQIPWHSFDNHMCINCLTHAIVCFLLQEIFWSKVSNCKLRCLQYCELWWNLTCFLQIFGLLWLVIWVSHANLISFCLFSFVILCYCTLA